MESASIQLGAADDVAGERTARCAGCFPVSPGVAYASGPGADGAALRAFEKVEEQVGRDAPRGDSGREVAVEVPELIPNAEPQRCCLVAPGFGFEVHEARGGEVANVPAMGEQDSGRVESGVRVEVRLEEAANLQKRFPANDRSSFGEEERRHARSGLSLAAPTSEPPVDRVAAPLLLRALLEVDVPHETGCDTELRVASQRFDELLDRPGQGIGVVVEHEQKLAAAFPARLVPAHEPDVLPGPDQAQIEVAARDLRVRAVDDDEHLV